MRFAPVPGGLTTPGRAGLVVGTLFAGDSGPGSCSNAAGSDTKGKRKWVKPGSFRRFMTCLGRRIPGMGLVEVAGLSVTRIPNPNKTLASPSISRLPCGIQL